MISRLWHETIGQLMIATEPPWRMDNSNAHMDAYGMDGDDDGEPSSS